MYRTVGLRYERLEDVEQLIATLLALPPCVSAIAFDRELRLVASGGRGFAGDDAALRGTRITDVLSAAIWRGIEPRFEAVVRGAVSSFDVTSTAGDARYWVHAAPLVDSDGVVRGGISVALDVTERVRIGLAQRQASTAFAAAPFGIALVEPASGRFAQVNEALCAMLGRSEQELLTIGIQDVTHRTTGRRAVSRGRGWVAARSSARRRSGATCFPAEACSRHGSPP